MEKNYQGKNGILYLLQKLKIKFADLNTEIEKKVAKEEGKGLSANDLTNELLEKINQSGESNFSGDYKDLTNKPNIPSKVSELTNDSGFQTAQQVASQVAAAGHITKEKVDVLPAEKDARENVIYLVPKPEAESKNVFDEYMLIDGVMEHLGDTKTDLTGYLKDKDLTEITNAQIDEVWNTVFGA